MHLQEIIKSLKSRREMLNVTQETVAQLSEIGLRTIKQLESGKGNPTLQTLDKVAEVLGMEIMITLKK
jgi:transcriptional regulator with XRE-family HTH domain